MSTLWSSLYCRSSDTAALTTTLGESLSTLGYQRYNPFGTIPGKAYRESVKLFVAPSRGGWLRVIGALDEALLLALSQAFLCLYLALDDSAEPITIYQQGQRAEATALLACIRAGKTADDLAAILAGKVAVAPITSLHPNNTGSPMLVPLDALPPDVQAMAGQVNTAQAQNLFSRLSGDMLKKMSGNSAHVEGAQALLHSEAKADWNSPAGGQIRALMDCLDMPDNWREPDFIALRDAYPLHERRRRSPNARAYPGDAEIMDAVPDALDYTPVYGGKI